MTATAEENKTEDTQETTPAIDWTARRAAAEARLTACKAMIRRSREEGYIDRTSKSEEYIAKVNDIHRDELLKAGGGLDYPMMTEQQRAEAAESAIKLVMREAMNLHRQGAFCSDGPSRVSEALGTPMPEAGYRHQWTIALVVEGTAFTRNQARNAGEQAAMAAFDHSAVALPEGFRLASGDTTYRGTIRAWRDPE